MKEGEDESMYKEKDGPKPKQRLLNWIQKAKCSTWQANSFTTELEQRHRRHGHPRRLWSRALTGRLVKAQKD